MSDGKIILYRTDDGKAALSLVARDGSVWMNQAQLAELFATSVPNISMHISNILQEKELVENSVVKDYLTTAADGKEYSVAFYALEMILAIGYRVRSPRGTQFRQWATRKVEPQPCSVWASPKSVRRSTSSDWRRLTTPRARLGLNHTSRNTP